jgi:LPS-assembly protein
VTLRFAPLVATLLVAFARLNAAETIIPQLTAQETRVTEQESVFTGEARLAHKDVVLYADEVVYRNQERVATARGNVILIRGAQRLVAEELTYRLDDQSYTVGRFRVGEGQLLAQGSGAEGTRDTLAVSDASLTYGEPDPLSPVLRARKLTYVEAENEKDSVARIEGARLGIGPVNILPLPTLSETPRNPSLADLDVKAGYGGNLGGELSLSGTTAVTDDLRLGADLGLFTKRGVLLGPIGDYDTFGADGTGARGQFRTGYIKDQGNPGRDIRGDLIRDERGYVEWQHQQLIAPGLTLSGQVNYWSDSYVTRDFRREGYYAIQTPDTWFEAQKLGDNFVVSLFTRVQANDWSLIQERLPEVRFDGLPVEVGGGIYHRVNASVAALREDDPTTSTGTLRSDRADLYYGVMRPFSPREWLAFTPVAGARLTHYERTPAGSNRDNYTRVLGEVGFDSELFKTSATWDYQNKRWGIDGIRHLITPKVAYRHSPSADVGRGSIPAIDDDPFNTYLRPLGLADRRDIDRLAALNTFRFGVDQALQTRDKTHGSRDLAELNVAIDQHADAEAAATQGQRRDRSDLHTFLALNPARWLRYDVYSRQTVQTGKMQELNTGLTVRDADIWSFRLGTHYLEDLISARQIQEYTATYGLRLSEIYSLVARVRFDSRTGDLTEQGLTFSQRLSRFWTAHYEFAAYDGPRREGDYGVSVSLETEGF